MATVITGDNVDVPGQVTVGTAPTLPNHVMRLTDALGGSTGVQVSALGGVAPVGAPAAGVVLEVDSDTNALYCWTGAVWLTLIAAP